MNGERTLKHWRPEGTTEYVTRESRGANVKKGEMTAEKKALESEAKQKVYS